MPQVEFWEGTFSDGELQADLERNALARAGSMVGQAPPSPEEVRTHHAPLPWEFPALSLSKWMLVP